MPVEDDAPGWLKSQIQQARTSKPKDAGTMGSSILDDSMSQDENVSLPDGEMASLPEESYAQPSVAERRISINTQDSTEAPAPDTISAQDTISAPDPATKEEFLDLTNELGHLLADKNRQYGDSYARMAHILPIFYPDGVPPDQLLDAVFILRIIDKLMRIASAQGDDKEDPVKDISGYGILRMREMRQNKNK